jgi:hypothetical protein
MCVERDTWVWDSTHSEGRGGDMKEMWFEEREEMGLYALIYYTA